MAAAHAPVVTADHWLPGCPHGPNHAHTYGTGGSVGTRSDTATGGNETGAGIVTVFETNTVDCDGDYDPNRPDENETADYDGDWETGIGGGFFGYGPWAHESVCNYALTTHSSTVVVNDFAHGNDVAFVIGADDTRGPVVTPVVDPTTGNATGEYDCTTDGSITPGDPATDPTADDDDCLTQVYVGTGTTCGAGGDGGYWVFLNGALVTEDGGSINPPTPPSGVDVSKPPTAGSITA